MLRPCCCRQGTVPSSAAAAIAQPGSNALIPSFHHCMSTGGVAGGQASNVATFVAHGDVALSVLMTAASTVAATVMTPTLTSLLAGAYIPVDGWVSELPVPCTLAVPTPCCLPWALPERGLQRSCGPRQRPAAAAQATLWCLPPTGSHLTVLLVPACLLACLLPSRPLTVSTRLRATCRRRCSSRRCSWCCCPPYWACWPMNTSRSRCASPPTCLPACLLAGPMCCLVWVPKAVEHWPCTCAGRAAVRQHQSPTLTPIPLPAAAGGRLEAADAAGCAGADGGAVCCAGGPGRQLAPTHHTGGQNVPALSGRGGCCAPRPAACCLQ